MEAPTVGNAVAEFVNGLSFVKSGKTLIVIGTVNADMTVDVLAKLLADFREEFLASFVARWLHWRSLRACRIRSSPP